MEEKELLRVVTLRKGKLKPAEFKLREGESGLSLFVHTEEPNAAEVIEAVRSVGKQGVLAAAVIPAQEIDALGLRLVQTKGELSMLESTPSTTRRGCLFYKAFFFACEELASTTITTNI